MENKMKKGLYALSLKLGSHSSFIPLNDENGVSIGYKLPLSLIDSITMQSKNESSLIMSLIQDGQIDASVLKKSFTVSIASLKKEDIRNGLNVSEVAYGKHALLKEFIKPGSKEVEKGHWTTAFISAFLTDISKNGLCWREIYYKRDTYDFSGLIENIRRYQKASFGDFTPSEAAEMFEYKTSIEAKITKYLLQDYKRIRDVYYFTKTVQKEHPNTKLSVTELETKYNDYVTSQKENANSKKESATEFDKSNDPDRDPFYNNVHFRDPFDLSYREQLLEEQRTDSSEPDMGSMGCKVKWKK